jgi:predicted CopG family antitoxin
MSKSIEVSDDLYTQLMALKREDETIDEMIHRLLLGTLSTEDPLIKWLVTPFTGDEVTDSVKEHDVVH